MARFSASRSRRMANSSLAAVRTKLSTSGMGRAARKCGALVAVQQADGKFLVSRDLTKRPAAGQNEDLSKRDRLYWIEQDESMVRSLASYLGLEKQPPFFVAIFPEKVEKELREKESESFPGSENDIEETRFQVVPRGTGYEIKVLD